MATVYVSSTGNDANSYAQAQSPLTPWLTIAKCNTTAVSGDTIIVMAGTITFASVTFTKSFIIQGATTDPSLYILDGAGAAVTWQNNTAGIYLDMSYLTFQNALGGASGCFSQAGGERTTFTNCVLYLTIPAAGYLFLNNGTNKAISLTNTVVRTAATTGAALITGGNAPQFNATGCTFYLPALSTAVVRSSGGTLTNVWKNCIVYCTGSTAYSSGVHVNTATYTCFYNITASPAGTGVITSDPLLVDPANGNFNLRPASPCLDTGVLI